MGLILNRETGSNQEAELALVVDDSSIARSVVKKAIESAGIAKCVEAEDGIEALECLKSNPISLIISDFDMPRMNGFELLQEVRGHSDFRSLPFMIITAKSTTENVKHAAELQATDFMKKPIEPDALVERVKTILKDPAFGVDLNANIMIVDDLASARKVIKNFLAELGFSNIAAASDGAQALKLTKSDKFDLILTDWAMPNMDGLDLLKHIRADAKLSETAVIMLTTYNEEERLLEAAESGANGYLFKPFDRKTLKQKLFSTLRATAMLKK